MKQKKNFLTCNKHLLFAFAIVVICLSSCKNEAQVIDQNQLPEGIQSFVQEHFQFNTIALVEVDKDSYDLKLGNDWDLSFTKKGELKSLDCKNRSVPKSILALIPEQISQYVKENYPEDKTHAISIDKQYHIELMSGLKLVFNNQGSFEKIEEE